MIRVTPFTNVASGLVCFLLGAAAPAGLVGWLLLAH